MRIPLRPIAKSGRAWCVMGLHSCSFSGLSLYKIDDKVRSDDSTQSVAQDEEALWQAQTTTCWTAGDSRFSDGATRPASRASAVPEIAKEGPSVRVSLRKQKRQSLKPRHDFRARQLPEAPRLEGDVSLLQTALSQPPQPLQPAQQPQRGSPDEGQKSQGPEPDPKEKVGNKYRTRFSTRRRSSTSGGKALAARTTPVGGWYSPIPVVTRRVSVLYEAASKADAENAAKGLSADANSARKEPHAGHVHGHAHGHAHGHVHGHAHGHGHAGQRHPGQQGSKGPANELQTLGLTMHVKEAPQYEDEKPPDRVSGLAKQLRIPLDILKQAYEVFDDICMTPDHPMSQKGKRTNKRGEVVEEEFDVFQDGELNIDGFARVLCKLIGCNSTSELPDGLVQRNFRDADGNSTKSVSFLEFAFWYSRHGFMENMLLTTAQLEVRELARKYNMPVIEVEQYKKKFDFFDEDRSGYIEYSEFENLLNQLVKVPASCEFPPGRVKQFWAEADRDRSSAISFEEFLLFYYRYFSLTNPTTCPFKEYYRGIRRVAVAHS
ncbi:petA [Symbiodinium microadriaticum]|nr:petA [Symbiodinium microadriaticum]